MKNQEKITILENDQVKFEGLPYEIERFQRKFPDYEYTVWNWFSQDVHQNPEKCIERLKELSKDNVFLCYPSFINYDNTFKGWTYFLSLLADLGVKLDLYLIFGHPADNEFVFYCLNYLQNLQGYSSYHKDVNLFEKALSSHNINVSFMRPQSLEDFKNISLDTVMSKYFKRKEKVKIKSTGEIKEVAHAWYHKRGTNEIELIIDEQTHENHVKNKGEYVKEAYKTFDVSELEKILNL